MKHLFTIGHGKSSLATFTGYLKNNGITAVVDVRSAPYSRFVPHFNRENFRKNLANNKIAYIFMGDLIGGQYDNKNLLFQDGIVDYAKVIKTKGFQEGIKRVEAGVAKGYQIALMCSENNPLRCHRFSMIGHYLDQKGFDIKHIVGEEIYEHKILERELLIYAKKYRDITVDLATLKATKTEEIDIGNLYTQLNRKVGYVSSKK